MLELAIIMLYIVVMLLVFKMPKRPQRLSGKSTVEIEDKADKGGEL